jgi:hypothetical protein
VWPSNAQTIEDAAVRKTVIFRKMFDDILLRRGNWCIDIDETHYMSGRLRLRNEITDLMEQGRSAGISMWNNTQRPADIPLAVYVNSSHAFFFSSHERYDLQRLGAIVNKHTNAKELMYNLERVDSFATHELIYIDRSGRIPPVRTIVDAKL